MGDRGSSAKNWGWAVTRRRWLNGSTISYLRARAHSRCEVSCQGVPHRRFVLRRGHPDSGESCIVLISWRTRSLVAKFPQRSVVACNTQILCCRERTLQTRPRTGACEPLMPDVVSLCELSGPTFGWDSLCSPILRSGTCSVHYIMHCKRAVETQKARWYVKLD